MMVLVVCKYIDWVWFRQRIKPWPGGVPAAHKIYLIILQRGCYYGAKTYNADLYMPYFNRLAMAVFTFSKLNLPITASIIRCN